MQCPAHLAAKGLAALPMKQFPFAPLLPLLPYVYWFVFRVLCVLYGEFSAAAWHAAARISDSSRLTLARRCDNHCAMPV